ncbi:SpoIIE family protein phosphatase [Streptomyces sp. HM190]|uniref:SpoIIE family protein phosphatase n=1 Tax=Streptomyces sp. HM190 TaxID=2695266 RepID=UPI001F3C271A|nr:SpoIIE family protein phosphatase [Streptomyces sp. HM190]
MTSQSRRAVRRPRPHLRRSARPRNWTSTARPRCWTSTRGSPAGAGKPRNRSVWRPIGLVVGDVVGHGTSAAATTGGVRTTTAAALAALDLAPTDCSQSTVRGRKRRRGRARSGSGSGPRPRRRRRPDQRPGGGCTGRSWPSRHRRRRRTALCLSKTVMSIRLWRDWGCTGSRSRTAKAPRTSPRPCGTGPKSTPMPSAARRGGSRRTAQTARTTAGNRPTRVVPTPGA